ncbi:MAG TPA: DUF420 domain-containing protein [Vicinamibacteria bacterium]|nr:DUF420 domain-containing protein [Vicinamibacteria bacterium]
MTERRALTLIAASSAIVLGFLFWLLYFREGSGEPPPWTASLPALNASLNLTSAVALSLGFIAIRRGRRTLHMKLMLTAVLVGLCFLVSYIVYHHYQGDTPFPGEGVVRPVYFSILISHIVLSIVGLPLVLATLFFAASGRFDRHRRLARVTFPVWLYVSITGVAVFVFLELW